MISGGYKFSPYRKMKYICFDYNHAQLFEHYIYIVQQLL